MLSNKLSPRLADALRRSPPVVYVYVQYVCKLNLLTREEHCRRRRRRLERDEKRERGGESAQHDDAPEEKKTGQLSYMYAIYTAAVVVVSIVVPSLQFYTITENDVG